MTHQLEYLLHHDEFRRNPVRTIARLAAWRVRCRAKRPVTLRLEKFGINMILPPLWRGQAKILYTFGAAGEWELELLAARLKPGAVVLDVGAHIGLWTAVLAKTVGASGRVLSFEPARDTYDVLRQNIAANRLANVTAGQAAASESEGTLRLYHHSDSTRNSLGRDPAHSELDYEEVATVTLDAAVARANVSRVDFIKIDVEGAEEMVLRGADSVLRFKPDIFFEVNPYAAHSLGLDPLGAWKLLKALGYHFYTIPTRAGMVEFEGPPDGGNVLALAR